MIKKSAISAWTLPTPLDKLIRSEHRNPLAYAGKKEYDFVFNTFATTPVCAIGASLVTNVYVATPEDVRKKSHRQNITIDLGDMVYVYYCHIIPEVGAGEHVAAGQRIGRQHPAFGGHVKHFHLLLNRVEAGKHAPYPVTLVEPE